MDYHIYMIPNSNLAQLPVTGLWNFEMKTRQHMSQLTYHYCMHNALPVYIPVGLHGVH